MEQSKVLWESDTHRIEFFPRSGGQPEEEVVFTFSAAMNRRLEGNFNGGSTLNRHGFDVISFKSVVEDWFQLIPADILEEIDQFCGSRGYRRRYGYGTSAGGFAAIAFSGRLHCSKVLAISPQFTIREQFDTRWRSFADAISWHYEITPDTVAQQCEFIFAFDPSGLDGKHIARISEVVKLTGKVTEVRIPFSGHDLAICLNEIGLLKSLPIITFLAPSEMDVLRREILKRKKRSTLYLHNVSKELIARGRLDAAISVMRRGHEVDAQFMGNFHYDPKIVMRFINSLNVDEYEKRAVLLRDIDALLGQNVALSDEANRLKIKVDELGDKIKFLTIASTSQAKVIKSRLPWMSQKIVRAQSQRLEEAQFDSDFYMAEHADVAASKWDAVTHYLKFGQFEGRRMRFKV